MGHIAFLFVFLLSLSVLAEPSQDSNQNAKFQKGPDGQLEMVVRAKKRSLAGDSKLPPVTKAQSGKKPSSN